VRDQRHCLTVTLRVRVRVRVRVRGIRGRGGYWVRGRARVIAVFAVYLQFGLVK